MIDNINPSHYKDLKISPIEIIESSPHLTWCTSNAIKYIMRAGLKDGNPIEQELRKAMWYLNHEIDRLNKLKGI